MPAPRCRARDLPETTRRVGRVDEARADPIGELIRRDDTPVAPEEPVVSAGPGVVSVIGGAPAGAPHTLQ